MRYASMRKLDISNGEDIGASIFVQGCHFHCFNCFNSETWDFKGGHEWTQEKEDQFFNIVSSEHIKRVSFLGGEPLASENLSDIHHLMKRIHDKLPEKKIWLYTGYTWEEIFPEDGIDDLDIIKSTRQEIVKMCDVVVDGPFIDAMKDFNLKWCGSSNQRVTDVKRTMREKRIVEWGEG